MNILLISYNDIEKDGRLNELKKVFEYLGNVFVITNTSINKCDSKNTIIPFIQKKRLSYISFILFCKRIVKNYKSLDMIVADNRNCILPVIICCKKIKCKVILYDARELYLFNEVHTVKGKIGCIIEKIFVPHFDLITCANQLRANVMKKIYRLEMDPIPFENIRKLEYSDLTEKECDEKYGDYFSEENVVNIVSTSGEALIRRSDDLVKAVAKLGKNYRLFLIGYEDVEGHDKIEKICDEYNWNNIVRYNWLSKSELKYIISHSDIGIVNYSFQNTNNILCASGKLYEFIYEGIPVVTTTNPTLRSICDEYKIGVYDDFFYDGIVSILNQYDYYKRNVEEFASLNRIEDNCYKVANKIEDCIKKLNKGELNNGLY